MSINSKKALLRAHDVSFYESKGRLWVDSRFNKTKPFEFKEDVTDWSRYDLMTWLGY